MAEDVLKNRIRQLEQELGFKQNELLQYKTQLKQINTKLEKLIAQMTVDQRLIQKIQKTLSPTQLPKIQGFDFSTKFIPGFRNGGDYFDIFELEDKMRFGILLASCSGYSTSALLMSVLMKISAQIEAKKGIEPFRVINQIAKELMLALKVDDLASVFYGIVDRRFYTLQYSVVGNISCFVQKAQQPQQLLEIESAGKGISNKFQNLQGSVSLDLLAKDRIVICSPGIIQSQDMQNEEFGVDRLKKTILNAAKSGSHELRNEVLFQLEKFMQTTEPPRDLTLLVTEVQEKVIKLTTL